MRRVDSVRAFSCRALSGLVVLLLVTALAGCGDKGPPLVKATGKVTQSGQPVSGASVMFIPEQGAPSGAKTDSAGRFELKSGDGRPGVVTGKHIVTIRVDSPEVPPPMGGQAAPPPPPKAPVEVRREAEVKASGENDFTFDIAQ